MLIRASLGGILYFLSFPPFDFWFLIFPALYFFYYSLLLDEKSFLTGFLKKLQFDHFVLPIRRTVNGIAILIVFFNPNFNFDPKFLKNPIFYIIDYFYLLLCQNFNKFQKFLNYSHIFVK